MSPTRLLPLVRTRAEAEALLGVALVGQQLDACVRALVADVEHERLLRVLRESAQVSTCEFDAVLCPLLAQAIAQARQRSPVQMGLVTQLVEHLIRLEATIRQYGMLNLTLAHELQGHAVDVAKQKKCLSNAELDLCSRINAVVILASSDNLLNFEELEGKLRSAERHIQPSAVVVSADNGGSLRKRTKLSGRRNERGGGGGGAGGGAGGEEYQEEEEEYFGAVAGRDQEFAAENSQNSMS